MSDYEITEEFEAEWHRVRAKVDGANGQNLDNTPTSLSHGPEPKETPETRWPQVCRARVTYDLPNSTNPPFVGRYNAILFFGASSNNPTNLTQASIGQLAGNPTEATIYDNTGLTLVELWNIAEITNSATLPMLQLASGPLYNGQIVFCWLSGFNSLTGLPIYQTSTGQGDVMVSINQTQAGGAGNGQYWGAIVAPSTVPAAGGQSTGNANFTTNYMDIPALVCNVDEQASGGHQLTPTASGAAIFLPGRFMSLTADGAHAIVFVHGGTGTITTTLSASPLAIDGTGIGPTAALPWSRTGGYGACPMYLYGLFENSSGQMVQGRRKAVFDGRGMLYSLDAEVDAGPVTNGFSGTGTYTTFTFVNGVCTAAS
jgi:hypothetical protein